MRHPAVTAIGSRATPNWGSTFAGDYGNLATRPEFTASVREEVFNSYAWIRSGIIRREPRIDAAQRGPRVEIPLIKPFIPVSETIESNSTWGANGKGFLSIQKINASQFQVPISHRGFAAGADELSVDHHGRRSDGGHPIVHRHRHAEAGNPAGAGGDGRCLRWSAQHPCAGREPHWCWYVG